MMVLFSFTQLEKKKGFEREEEDVEDGFIPIHPIAKKEKKRFEREEDGEDEEMELG